MTGPISNANGLRFLNAPTEASDEISKAPRGLTPILENRSSRNLESNRSLGLQKTKSARLQQFWPIPPDIRPRIGSNPLPRVLVAQINQSSSTVTTPPVTARDILETQDALKRKGATDIQAVASKEMKNVDVLAVGEAHDDAHATRQKAGDILEGARSAGATKLFIEANSQAGVDKFLTTGDASGLPALLRHPEYLKTAERLGMKVIAVDLGRNDRDATMAANIQMGLAKGEKGVFWVGEKHALPVEVGYSGEKYPTSHAAGLINSAGLSTSVVVGQSTGPKETTGIGKLIGKVPAAVAIDPKNLPLNVRNLDTVTAETPVPVKEPTTPLRGANVVIFN